MRWAGVLLACGALVLASTPRPPASAHPAAKAHRPSIVLILTDDQRWDALDGMPIVQNDLVAHGVDFRQAFVVNSACCPSRTSILTGNYSHTTGVYDNSWPYGGFRTFHTSGDEASTVATWLDHAGYHTALIGKYLNQYRNYSSVRFIPPGWDRWFTFYTNGGGEYYNYKINDQGHLRSYGKKPSAYSTDVLAGKAVSFINNTDGPLFLYFAPSAPHFPSTPAQEDKFAFHDLAPARPPNFDELDETDKPAWLQRHPRFGPRRARQIDALRKRQYRALLDVDRAVGRIVNALQRTGRLDNTMIVFASDNGLMWGEHRLWGKFVPYEESIRIPLIIRYDPLTSAPSEDTSHLALNMDLAPTFAEAAGVRAPATEGRSLMPLLSGQSPSDWRTQFLIEHYKGRGVPEYCAIRTDRYMYADYAARTGPDEEELYDLSADPYELDNKANDPTLAVTRLDLRMRLKQLCQPPPPGYSLTP